MNFMLGKFTFRQFNSVVFNVIPEVLILKLPNKNIQAIYFTLCAKLKVCLSVCLLHPGIVLITEVGKLAVKEQNKYLGCVGRV